MNMDAALDAIAIPHNICQKIRKRIYSTSFIKDVDLMTMSILAVCNEAEEALEFVCSRSTYRELKSQIDDLSLRSEEWSALFSDRCVSSGCVDVVSSEGFRAISKRIEEGMPCTLMESDQSRRWGHPLIRVAVYVALHSKRDVEERVSAAIGSVVRTDVRKLEDLRSSFENEGSNLIMLTKSAVAASRALGM
jgi:hypothetical protein